MTLVRSKPSEVSTALSVLWRLFCATRFRGRGWTLGDWYDGDRLAVGEVQTKGAGVSVESLWEVGKGLEDCRREIRVNGVVEAVSGGVLAVSRGGRPWERAGNGDEADERTGCVEVECSDGEERDCAWGNWDSSEDGVSREKVPGLESVAIGDRSGPGFCCADVLCANKGVKYIMDC